METSTRTSASSWLSMQKAVDKPAAARSFAPSTFLTAAHCIADDPAFPPFEVIHVSFEPVAYDSPPERPLVPPKNAIEATADPHPDWTWEGELGDEGGRGFPPLSGEGRRSPSPRAAARPRSHPGITPAPIVGAGVFDERSSRDRSQRSPRLVTALSGPGPRAREGSIAPRTSTRNQSKFPLTKIRPRMIFGHANPNDNIGFGMPCFGDSGSPWFFQGAVGLSDPAVNGVCNNGGGGHTPRHRPSASFPSVPEAWSPRPS